MIRNVWQFRFAQVLPGAAHTLMRRYMLTSNETILGVYF
ncbi:hypothetical protein VCHA37P192_20260 [Vibrio chagasii]|nr:hypothetical protein VCHA38O210_10129 [Vibrio chagasii]CAH7354602.1 hypothetical protein VCHA37P192_20260 [Vibrio chagasii]